MLEGLSWLVIRLTLTWRLIRLAWLLLVCGLGLRRLIRLLPGLLIVLLLVRHTELRLGLGLKESRRAGLSGVHQTRGVATEAVLIGLVLTEVAGVVVADERWMRTGNSIAESPLAHISLWGA